MHNWYAGESTLEIDPVTLKVDSSFESSQTLDAFAPIGLDEMNTVALLDRTDTKYVLPVGQVKALLAILANRYRILEINGVRTFHYETLYFDSADFSLYFQHHAGRPIRYKVRSRRYVDTDSSFIEVKVKNAAGRTKKHRLTTDALVTDLFQVPPGFFRANLPAEIEFLNPKLFMSYQRITLVGLDFPERLTIDTNLEFRSDCQTMCLPDLAVAEVKQAKLCRDSPFVALMRSLGQHPTSFSKYCIGVALLYQHVKHNRFKPELSRIERVVGGPNVA